MFTVQGEHNVVINHREFTNRLMDDILERAAALRHHSGIGPNAFNGDTAPAVIDGYDTRLYIVGVNFPDDSRVIGGSVRVSAQVEKTHIYFTVQIVE